MEADLTAEQVQARLEEKRRGLTESAPLDSTTSKSEVSVETVTEDVTCRCGETFERTVTKIGGEVRGFPPVVCDACHARRHEPVELPTASTSDDWLHEALADAGVNVRKHGACRIESWAPGASDTPATACEEFVADVLAADRWTFVRSVYLCGKTGTGKTHLAVGVLREIVEQAGPRHPTIRFVRANRLITDIQDTYGSGKTDAVLGPLERVDVLVLDDLGAEKATPDVLRILTDLMSAREGHPTLITSNDRPDELVGRWKTPGWERLASRLATQNFRTVLVKGDDRRFRVAS